MNADHGIRTNTEAHLYSRSRFSMGYLRANASAARCDRLRVAQVIAKLT
jgi:hypothetical protein